MRILTDLHHFDLYYSFQLLFEKRLKAELYRPIGMEWLEENYWKIHSGKDEVAECYLSEVSGKCNRLLSNYNSFYGKPWAVYGLHLPRMGKIIEEENGIYKILDRSKNVWQTGITLEQFKKLKFDILLASTPAQAEAYQELIRLYQPQAKLILQMGNKWPIPNDVNNLMLPYPYAGCETRNSVVYHQEFDLNVFEYSPHSDVDEINCYVWFPESETLMNEVSSYLPSIKFNTIGNIFGPRDKIILETNTLASRIRRSLFTWLIKPGGEGYGHILFNSFASGTPLLIQYSDYANSAGADLLIDGKTCIFLDGRSPNEIARLINYYLQPENYILMRQNVYDQFRKVVDFDKEFKQIELFLERLI